VRASAAVLALTLAAAPAWAAPTLKPVDEGPRNPSFAAFEQQWHLRAMDSLLWRELGATLALGGTFDPEGSFVAPYVYSRWPEAIDAVGHVAIAGSGVRVRAQPSLDGKVIGRLSYAIMPIAQGKLRSEDAEWARVEFAPSRSGYVASRHARSPVGYRAFFTRGAAGWRMVMFLSGD